MDTKEQSLQTGGAQFATFINQNHATATDEVVALTQRLLENFGSNAKDPAQLQGDVFEYIEAWKFNQNAALAKSNIRAEVSNAVGSPHDPTDIRIKAGTKVIKEVQAKSSKNAVWVLKAGTKPKYAQKEILTNPENGAKVKELAQKAKERQTPHAKEFGCVAKRTAGELRHGKISSGGTSHDEAMKGAKNIGKLISKERIKAGVRETSV
jgi:hypothetical protein